MSAKVEEKMTIYQKLAKIRKSVEVMRKNKSGYGYTYVTEEAILANITGLMDKYELSLIPGIVPGTTTVTPYYYEKTKFTKDGKQYIEKVNEILVQADSTWTWVDNTDPESCIVVPWSLVGQQSDASQAFGSGLSYCSRYFLLKYFNVSTTEDDPDNWRSRQREAEEGEAREIAAGIVEQIREYLNVFIAANPDKEKDVKKIIMKHVIEKGKPSVNYLGIKKPEVATALFDDLKATLEKDSLEVK